MPRFVSAVAVAAVLAPVALRAQAAPVPASMVPAPMVTALLSDPDRRPDAAAAYFDATLPPGWPASAVVPAGAAVVGGMTARGGLVALFDLAGARALSAFDSVFEQAGWRHPHASPRETGFVNGAPQRVYFCRDSAYLSASSVAGRAGSRFVLVRYMPPSATQACETAREADVPTGTLEFPRLLAPKGSYSAGGRGSGGSDEQTASAAIQGTSFTPKQLLDHYASQLTAAGWSASPAVFTDRAAIQPFDARDASGATWQGALAAVARGKTLDVTLTMYRVKP